MSKALVPMRYLALSMKVIEKADNYFDHLVNDSKAVYIIEAEREYRRARRELADCEEAEA